MGTSTVTGTVRIEGMQEQIEANRNMFKEGMKDLEKTVEKNFRELKDESLRISTKLDTVAMSVNLHEYRLNDIQNNKKRAGDRSPI